MPQSPGSQSDLTSADFGANEWLVEEMYDQYQRDPGSVDATWATYFKTNGHANGGNGTTTATKPVASAPAPAKPAEKAAAPAQEHAPDPTPTPAPVAKPRPETKAAEPAKGSFEE